MVLRVKLNSSLISKKSIGVFFAVLIFILQQAVSFNIPSAFAASVTDYVVINEIMAVPLDGEKEWVELYNPTASLINLDGWTIAFNNDTATYPIIPTTEIAAGGFVVVEAPYSKSYLNDLSDKLILRSDTSNIVDSVVYKGGLQNMSYARSYDASTDFIDQASPTKNMTNGTAPIADEIPPSTPIVEYGESNDTVTLIAETPRPPLEINDDKPLTLLSPVSTAITYLPVNTVPDNANYYPVAQATSTADSVDNGEVLGRQDSEPTDNIAAISPSEQGWKIFGFAWYWWVLILAVIAAIWWAVAGYRRRNNEEA